MNILLYGYERMWFKRDYNIFEFIDVRAEIQSLWQVSQQK